MTVADDIKTILTADATLMALLTGGVHTGMQEISRQDTPSAFDANMEILPCALIKIGTEIPRGPYMRSTQTVIHIYFYQRTGNATIESAMDRTYDLLHDTRIGARTFAILHDNTLHSYDIAERQDNALQSSMAMQRYLQVRLR